MLGVAILVLIILLCVSGVYHSSVSKYKKEINKIENQMIFYRDYWIDNDMWYYSEKSLQVHVDYHVKTYKETIEQQRQTIEQQEKEIEELRDYKYKYITLLNTLK